MRIKRLAPQFTAFTIFSAAGTMMDFALFNLVIFIFGFDNIFVAYLLGVGVGSTVSFTLNLRFNFKGEVEKLTKSAASYLCLTLFIIGISFLLTELILATFGENILLANAVKIVVTAVFFVAKFLISRRWIFV